MLDSRSFKSYQTITTSLIDMLLLYSAVTMSMEDSHSPTLSHLTCNATSLTVGVVGYCPNLATGWESGLEVKISKNQLTTEAKSTEEVVMRSWCV